MRTFLGKEQGFTLVELMIATAVFSTVLLLATTGIINIGRLYYKGITTARTQESARSIIDELSRSVQLTDGEIKEAAEGHSSGYSAVCVGADRYTYKINTKVEDGIRGLWLDKITEGDKCSPSGFSFGAGGRELLGANMRLIGFSVDDTIGDDSVDRTRVQVRVGVAYGDNDLLTTYDNSGVPTGADPSTARCKPTNSGGSFCAVSTLETFVKRRFSIVYLN